MTPLYSQKNWNWESITRIKFIFKIFLSNGPGNERMKRYLALCIMPLAYLTKEKMLRYEIMGTTNDKLKLQQNKNGKKSQRGGMERSECIQTMNHPNGKQQSRPDRM